VAARAHEEPGRHHFDVIDALAEPESPLMQALLGRRSDDEPEQAFGDAARDYAGE
jgi:hypothetical protein